jgi:hypothetical protein
MLGAAGWSAPPVAADGDPASDVLLAQNVFYPYQPRVSGALEAALSAVLREASSAGLNLKVAIIGSAPELGLVPSLFGHPQAYARFLDREISFNQLQPLLVVMPAGFGLAAAGPASALAGVSVDQQHRSYGLTRSAILAVVALASARGHPIATPSIPRFSSPGSSPPALLIFGVPAALLALGGLLAMRSARARGARARDHDGAPHDPGAA